MSTTIQDNVRDTDQLRLIKFGAEIEVQVKDGTYTGSSAVYTADFIAAVATELDAIVIERGELPEVDLTWDKRAVMVDGIEYPIGASSSAEEYREIAGRALALADYLDAHPPVDEAQVTALTGAIDRLTTGADYFDAGNAADLARALVLAGARIEAAK